MTDKQKTHKTTLYLPKKLHEEIKKREINLSEWVRENIEYELYQDKPEYIKRKIQELDQEHTNKKNTLLAKLKIAEEKQQKKAKELNLPIKDVVKKEYGIEL